MLSAQKQEDDKQELLSTEKPSEQVDTINVQEKNQTEM